MYSAPPYSLAVLNGWGPGEEDGKKGRDGMIGQERKGGEGRGRGKGGEELFS